MNFLLGELSVQFYQNMIVQNDHHKESNFSIVKNVGGAYGSATLSTVLYYAQEIYNPKLRKV